MYSMRLSPRFSGETAHPIRASDRMADVTPHHWQNHFRDLARSDGWSFEIEMHPDGGIPRAVRHFADFQQVISLHLGGANGNSIAGGLVIPAIDQTRQDLFGGHYDPRTDHPMCYECSRISLSGGETLPEISALEEAFTGLAWVVSRLAKPGALGLFLADRKSRPVGSTKALSWIALNRLAWGEAEARRLIDEELAELRRWSIGNAIEAVVFKLLRLQAKKRDIQRLEAAKERLGRITSEVDPQRFQFPMMREERER
jgi:hypothetical protein